MPSRSGADDGGEGTEGEPRPAKGRRKKGRGSGPGGGRAPTLRPISTLVHADIRGLAGYLQTAYQGGSEFRLGIAEGLNSLPSKVHAAVHAAGGKVVTCNLLVTYAPHLAGQAPRGGAAGKYEELGGLYLPDQREAVIAEYFQQEGQPVLTPALASVVREEVAHALDHALGDASHNDRAFIGAYRVERQRVKNTLTRLGATREAAALRYILQRGHAGAEEAFAVLVAIMHGGWLLPELDQAILTRFPRAGAAVETIIQNLPGERATS